MHWMGGISLPLSVAGDLLWAVVYTVATLAILSPPVPHGQKTQLASKSGRAGKRHFCLCPVVASGPAGYHSVGKFLPSPPLMVDSGADDSFIDEKLAKQSGLPLIELPMCVVQDLNCHMLTRTALPLSRYLSLVTTVSKFSFQ